MPSGRKDLSQAKIVSAEEAERKSGTVSRETKATKGSVPEGCREGSSKTGRTSKIW